MLNEAEAKRRRFDDFVTGEFENLLALALSTLRNEEDALDVAQETMSRVWSRWPEVERLDRPGAWARRVALNLVTDRLRSKGRRQRLLSRLHRQVPLASHDTVEERDEALWSAVKVLPTGQREAVTLFYVLDLSVSTIAETLRVPEGTVKSDLSRARRRLRRQLEGSSNG